MVEVLHSQHQITGRFNLKVTSGGHLRQLSSLKQVNLKINNVVRVTSLSFREGEFSVS